VQKIDLASLGYDKLLGAGDISIPLRIKVEEASSSAVQKVSEAGGEVLVSEE